MRTLILALGLCLASAPVRAVEVQSITIGPAGDSVTIISRAGTRTLTAASIPANQKLTILAAETFANTWAAANIPEFVVVVHVFSLAPFQWTIWTGNPGLSPPANWWL